MYQRCCSWLLAVCFTLAPLSFAADGKRSITATDLYNFRWIADAQISGDGTEVIYTLVKTTAKNDDYQSSLGIVPSAGGPARQLTSGPRDSGARWSPDGKLVAFLRRGDKAVQIYLLSMSGREARPPTELPSGDGQE